MSWITARTAVRKERRFHAAPFGAKSLALLLKAEGQRIDAVARTFGTRPVVKDMTEVRVAALAADLGAVHAVAVVLQQPNVLARIGMGEARPAAARLVFGVRAEERRAAPAADIGPFFLIMQQRAGERSFGRRPAKHGKLLGGQLLLPLSIRLLNR